MDALIDENRRLRKALEYIVEWKLPPSKVAGRPCSYAAAYGSNGERDHMRKVAKDAL